MAEYVALARRAVITGSSRRLAVERARLSAHRRQIREELRAMLTDYCAALRAQGMPPERMVIAIKDLASEALGTRSTLHTNALRGDLLAWAIEGYYA